jgi:hypothetical protein
MVLTTRYQSPVKLRRAVQTTGTSHQFATQADPRAQTSTMSVIHTPAIAIHKLEIRGQTME